MADQREIKVAHSVREKNKVGKERFPKLKDGQVLEINLAKKEMLRLQCCDCGLVHRIAFTVKDNGKLGIGMKREKRTTNQQRKTFRSEDKLCLWPFKKCQS